MNERRSRVLSPLQRHHRQAAWQIWLPAAFGAAIFLALAVLAVILTFGDQPIGKNWASISVIWWILPSCLGGIIGLALMLGSVFVASKAIQGLPKLGAKAQAGVDRLGAAVKGFSDRAAKPLIKAYGWQAAWASLRKSPQAKKKDSEEGNGSQR